MLSMVSENSVVVFLGDNIYLGGMFLKLDFYSWMFVEIVF